jgi:hypothetical protein
MTEAWTPERLEEFAAVLDAKADRLDAVTETRMDELDLAGCDDPTVLERIAGTDPVIRGVLIRQFTLGRMYAVACNAVAGCTEAKPGLTMRAEGSD